MVFSKRQKRTWAEIDLDAAEYNFKRINAPVCCVIKADAYGHGAIQLAKLYADLGARFLAVSNIEEALQIRKAGIKLPILILGYTPSACVNDLERFNISQCVYSLDYAKLLSDNCVKKNIRIKIHIKIDTGMGRIGFRYHDCINELEDAFKACNLPGFVVEGIFTHFSVADEKNNEFTKKQFTYYDQSIKFLEKKGVKFSIRHCSNSAAILDYPKYSCDMVRAGIILYGINPTLDSTLNLKNTFTLKSVVSMVKLIHKGDSVSYGRDYIAKKDTMVATIPIGYADGFFRSNVGGYVYINHKYCKIIGRVCMDQIMVECFNAKIGDEVEIFGEHISVNEVASRNNTIPYEIFCSISKRVPRVYIRKKKIIAVTDKLI